MIDHITLKNENDKESKNIWKTGIYRHTDNFWSIASIAYGNGKRWKELRDKNIEKYPQLIGLQAHHYIPSNLEIEF